MAGRSSLKSLPPKVLEAVHDAIGRGETIDKDVTSSSKIDIEREAKIREEEARRTREQAAADATAAGRAAGASEATLAAIRTRILGFAA